MKRLSLIALTGLMLPALPVLAYVVAPSAIVRQFATTQASDHIAPSPMIGRARLAGVGGEVGARLELMKGGCKSQLDLAAGKSIATLSGGRVTTEGAPSTALHALTALACPLIAIHDLPADEAETLVQTFAKSLGVDYAVSALSMVDGKVGLIVGAHPRQLQRPQIWFDKATNRPLRIVASDGGQVWDIRMLDAASIATNRQAPRVVTVWSGGEQQLQVQWMATNPRPPNENPSASTVEEEGED